MSATHLPEDETHDPFRRLTDLLQRLSPGRMRIGFLLGAGCPLSVRENGGPLIPDIVGLTGIVKEKLEKEVATKDAAAKIWARAIDRGIKAPTIEDILSHIRTLRSLTGSKGVDGFTATELTDLDSSICKIVREAVDKKLPVGETPYHTLASWIQAIPRNYPVEVFTTNYDELVEQAFEDRNLPYFDGFVGSISAFLDLDSMQENVLPARWARLWKLHGSINWWLTNNKRVRRSRHVVKGEQLLIYPSHLKYDQSRQMPYLAMLDRLRSFLKNHQTVLITCGYSFADEHINAYIAQGLSGNPNASCLALVYGDLCSVGLGKSLAKKHANLSILAADGAVVGTVEKPWSCEERESFLAYSPCISKNISEGRSIAPAERCKFLLGDFSALGGLLASQLSGRILDSEQIDAE